jgi:hypothetical protein
VVVLAEVQVSGDAFRWNHRAVVPPRRRRAAVSVG